MSHNHEQGAPLKSDCDNWCRAKYEGYVKSLREQIEKQREALYDTKFNHAREVKWRAEAEKEIQRLRTALLEAADELQYYENDDVFKKCLFADKYRGIAKAIRSQDD